MKKQIRRNVFETNSSSMHSLVIMKRNDVYTADEFLDGIYLHKDKETGEPSCIWEPWSNDMEFGRSPFRPLGTFKMKWLYACASLVKEYNDETYKELENIAFKYVPGLKKIRLPITSESVANRDSDQWHKDDKYIQKYGKTEKELVEFLLEKEEKFGMKLDYWESSNGWWHYDFPFTGYVDEDVLSGFLSKENISLEEFLINKKYVVIQDGDEYCYWIHMKKTGLVNMDKIEKEY